jgi:hypothetical protein
MTMNEEIGRLVAGLRQWRQQFGATAETPQARQALKQYVCANETALRSALAAVKAMPYREMERLRRAHPELNAPEGAPVDYAAQLIDALCGPDSGGLLTDIDDYVNVLKRVVEYAQYS